MSVQNRLRILLLLIGLIPLLIVLSQSNLAMSGIEDDAGNILYTAIKQMGSENTHNSVQIIGEQLNTYIDSHPEVSFVDIDALRKNNDLALIAINSLGKNGYTMVFNDQLEVIYHPNPDMVAFKLSEDSRQSSQYLNILSASLTNPRSGGFFDWRDNNNRTTNKYMAVSQVGNTTLRVAGIVETNEIMQAYFPRKIELEGNAIRSRNIQAAVGLIVGILTLLAVFIIGKEATSAIKNMAEDARRMMRELPNPKIMPEKADDLVVVHHGITNAAIQLREMRITFEQQVQARIADLARRNTQIEAIVQVAHEAADVLDIQHMLAHSTKLISDSFGFYHTGIFLIDEAAQYAILIASNSEGGNRLLEREHKIKIGEGGVVSYVATNTEPYYVHNVFTDSIHTRNQELINTRSELALPMKVHGELIGVLDVQSTEPEAYNREDIKILQILADQIALAIQNARLLKASQQTLREMYHLYGENIKGSWSKRRGRKPVAYAFNRLGVEPVFEIEDEKYSHHEVGVISEDNIEKLIVPITLRGQCLGSIVLTREAEQGKWRQEDVLFIQEVVQQVAPALENARLVEEINRRAKIEQQIGRISAKTLSTLNMETVVKTAVQEIGIALDAARVQIRLKTSEPVQFIGENGEGADRT